MKLIPNDAVVVNWHYGAQATFEPYIQTIARGGFEQMIAPGASNWNEVFPNIDAALVNERRFVDEGKAAHVLGLFQTVWHDDGETLYEATWYPVIYSAAAAWQDGDVAPDAFARDFPFAFFGVDDQSYSDDIGRLGAVLRQLEPADYPYGQTDALFWADPFEAGARSQVAKADLRLARMNAETVEQDLYFKRPPLHANAAFVMFLAARRYSRPLAKFLDLLPKCGRCTTMRARTPPPIAFKQSVNSYGVATGCGSCAMRTKTSLRFTRAPGCTKAAPAICRVISSDTTLLRRRRSSVRMHSIASRRNICKPDRSRRSTRSSRPRCHPERRCHPEGSRRVTAALILLVFALFAVAMYRRWLPALVAVPAMAIVMSLVAGVPALKLGEIVTGGAIALAPVYVAVIFGALLGRVTVETGIARTIVDLAAEYGGEQPLLLSLAFCAIVALLFTSLSGLGGVIMVGSIVLPIMMTAGVPRTIAATLFLMSFALGFIFNIANLTFYTKYFGVPPEQLVRYAIVLSRSSMRSHC